MKEKKDVLLIEMISLVTAGLSTRGFSALGRLVHSDTETGPLQPVVPRPLLKFWSHVRLGADPSC